MQAAGGLVWRTRADADAPGEATPADDPATSRLLAESPQLRAIELVMVHRPRYDDWSLPKGKAEAGESAGQTAVREVEEETGLRCRRDVELVTVHYETDRGEQKTVRWWAMTVERDLGFTPNDEVDEVRWVDVAEFARRATFPTDREVVHSLVTSGALET